MHVIFTRGLSFVKSILILSIVLFSVGLPIYSLQISSVLAVSVQLGDSAGSVHLMKITDPSSDSFTNNPTVSQEQSIAGMYSRILAYSPYWDTKLSWFPNAWFYQDSYAIYTSDTATIQAHPDWILKDSNGKNLYIQYACGGGTCTQYAADISNPAYRQWWIANATANMNKGYKGLYVDDVNMDWRISDGNGTGVCNGTSNTSGCPIVIDPNTGTAMTLQNWRMYFVQFLQQIRTAFPNNEIVHNSIWYASDTLTDPYIQQEIKSANYVDIENGVTDNGITGGTGQFSLSALQNYVDYVHSLGTNVVIGNYDTTDAGKEYTVANYFLVSRGSDIVGNSGATDFPPTYWSGYNINLGTPLGGRYMWNGLIRRDFSGGIVLVNPPGASAVTATLSGTYTRVDGTKINSITLYAKQGAVLIGDHTVTVNLVSPATSTVVSGSSFNLTYNWANGPTTNDQKVFVHFFNASTWALALQDDHYPPVSTSHWSGNYSYTRSITVPSSLAPGNYYIYSGLYDPTMSGGPRLTLNSGIGVTSPFNDLQYLVGTLIVSTTTPPQTPPIGVIPPTPTPTPPTPTSTPPVPTPPAPVPTPTPPTPTPTSPSVPFSGGGGGGGGGSSYIPPASPSSYSPAPVQTTVSGSISTTSILQQQGENNFISNSHIETVARLNVRSTPSIESANVLCLQSANSAGTIVSGPVSKDGYVWWNINYDTGCDGWSIQNHLQNYTLNNSAPAQSVTFSFPLDKGAHGSAVISLQTLLSHLGYLSSNLVTGYFGMYTESAVEHFQCDKAIVCSGSPTSTGFGHIGPKTLNAIILAGKNN